jgi:hypothetical protein
VSYSSRNRPAALGALLASSRDAAARQAGTAIDREQWRRIVGERIAARTEPGPKRGRELLVYVASASWAQELSLLVTEIVVRLKAAGIAVDHVRFSVRAIAQPTRDAAALKPQVRKAALPEALSQKLDGVEDPELREAIADAAALWLALGDAAPTPTAKKGATSARPAARSPRAAESQSAHSDRRSPPGRARPKDKP